MRDAERDQPVCDDTYAKVFMNEQGLQILEAFKDETQRRAPSHHRRLTATGAACESESDGGDYPPHIDRLRYRLARTKARLVLGSQPGYRRDRGRHPVPRARNGRDITSDTRPPIPTTQTDL